MEWRIISEAELSALYDVQLGRDFAPEELRPRQAALALCRAGLYRPWCVYDADGALAAYLFVAQAGPEGPVLLDYFAVLPHRRGEGLGAKLLGALAEKEQRPILIESEWPERAPDPDMARRRLAFYRRCGAVRTPYFDRAFQGWFYVFLLQQGGCTPAQLEAAGPQLSEIYRALMPGQTYARDFEYGRASDVSSQNYHMGLKD